MKAKTLILMALALSACSRITVWETSPEGGNMVRKTSFTQMEETVQVTVNTAAERQTITGIGGAFTESTSSLLAKMSPARRQEVIDAYFGPKGAAYSLTRTHIGSCDFSRGHYCYAPVEGDTALEHFSIDPDRETLLPLIKDAQAASKDGFDIVASPWTAPWWMKDNKAWIDGWLLPEYRQTFADYMVKYLQAYKAEGVDIWGVTVMNEPYGNGGNWESCNFRPADETAFVNEFLGPAFEAAGFGDVKILGYDQNRAGIPEWVDVMYADEESGRYFDGLAIHWYESTWQWFPDLLEYAHAKAPGKYLIETEGCDDAEVPHWRDDAWYWQCEATDWGWDWAPADQRYLHPKYVPVHRYARDIIGCLNSWVDGWIDWNLVLDRAGGPNWANNWCLAPVIVDPEADEIYYTPIYYAMVHFSRFLRPGAKVLATASSEAELMATAVRNPDGSLAVVLLNQLQRPVGVVLNIDGKQYKLSIAAEAIQTIVLK